MRYVEHTKRDIHKTVVILNFAATSILVFAFEARQELAGLLVCHLKRLLRHRQKWIIIFIINKNNNRALRNAINPRPISLYKQSVSKKILGEKYKQESCGLGVGIYPDREINLSVQLTSDATPLCYQIYSYP